MRSSQATFRHTADPPGGPPEASAGRPGADGPARDAVPGAAWEETPGAVADRRGVPRRRPARRDAHRSDGTGASDGHGRGVGSASPPGVSGRGDAADGVAVASADAASGALDASATAGPGGARSGAVTSADPAAVDAGVVDAGPAAALQPVLARLLAARLEHARRLDPVFARDLAERVAGLTLHGGRRIRPRMLWWALRACGGGDPAQVRAALRAGAALELLQTCALVHDDVMDAAETRRGRPALHTAVARQYAGGPPGSARRLGDAAAVLAGDLALTWADDEITDLLLDGAALPPGAVARVRELWRATRTEMVAGQYLDVHGQASGPRSTSHALRAARLKSALYTVERPLGLGAALAGARPAVTQALRRAGRCAGLAFQLRDDLDDLFADPAVTGKPSGGDVREGKPTYLMAAARARAADDPAALAVLDAVSGDTALTEDDLDRVRDVLTGTGARALVRREIERLTDRALRILAATALEPGPAAALRALFTGITGFTGSVGSVGSAGSAGSVESAGSAGSTGSAGSAGATRSAGSAGCTGVTGASGSGASTDASGRTGPTREPGPARTFGAGPSAVDAPPCAVALAGDSRTEGGR
jgi:geranylgeranyl diphosphate synthase type I